MCKDIVGGMILSQTKMEPRLMLSTEAALWVPCEFGETMRHFA